MAIDTQSDRSAERPPPGTRSATSGGVHHIAAPIEAATTTAISSSSLTNYFPASTAEIPHGINHKGRSRHLDP